MRITLQPAFVLHARPYRETSLLLDFFTQAYGRISLIARGVRQRKTKLRALLQPFVPLMISWQGKGELMMLVSCEANGLALQLQKECLFSGFYLNELLTRLLQKHDPHPELYTIYQKTLLELQGEKLQEKTLRYFEKKLLQELGYGMSFQQDANGESLLMDKFYQFDPEKGFNLALQNESKVEIFSGKSLLALATEQLEDEINLREAKRLMRTALASLLGSKPLESRKLFE